MVTPLTPEQLYRHCDLSSHHFDTTDELPDFEGMLGQARAGEAVDFGLSIRREGFNLYVMGPSGMGKHTLVMAQLAEIAARGPVPSDWVYVNNFEKPHNPKAIALPPGKGMQLKADMRHLVDDLLVGIPAVFESDEYRSRLEEIENGFAVREGNAFSALSEKAKAQGVAMVRTPTGFGLAPLQADGEVIEPDEFEKLPDTERERIAKVMEEMRERLHKLIRQAPQWGREKRARIRELNHEFSMLAVEHQLTELRAKYQDIPAVLDYLKAVERDLVENADDFRKSQDAPAPQILGVPITTTPSFKRYQVNPLVDHAQTQGAPVVTPDHPGYPNLIGRIEHMEHLGSLVTDFTLIKPGALHMANGGYLVIDARKLLMQPYAWEGLKRVMRAGQIKVESLGQMLSLVSTLSLEPEPIPLDVKVVLLGERLLYYLLFEYDPEFHELFKVVADFEDETPRDAENQRLYARLIATLTRKEKLLPFDRAACARLIEQAAREAEDAERLSTNMQSLLNLMREADFLARRAGCSRIELDQVRAAVEARERRSGRLPERYREAILRETLRIETSGTRIGQVNGLAVVELGDSRFAHPSRIAATVRYGEGEFVDIQREIDMGGSIHSKGVLTLASFLATRFASNQPLSLAATLTFEQTYGAVEGDSASMAELCVLLSALGDLPIKQSMAITGSVDLYGNMQAIGGVNEKIEGFFDLCNARGLTGEQGVLIPAANIKHLMLRADVVEACAQGRFHVWPIASVDEAIGLLTDTPAGEPDEHGIVPPGSVNYLVGAKLLQYFTLKQTFAGTLTHTPHKKKPRGKKR